MVQGVIPAHKGLAPSKLIIYLSANKRCPCWAHTQYISYGLDYPYLENLPISQSQFLSGEVRAETHHSSYT